MSSKTPTKLQSTSPMGPDGIIRCHHGEQVERLVSRTRKNPGREFYACSRPSDEGCHFWYWADDPIFRKRPQTTPQVAVHTQTPSLRTTQTVLANGLCTPQSSAFYPASTSAPQSTPAKRKCPDDFTTDPRDAQLNVTPTAKLARADTPSRSARLEAIEAGLRARMEDELSRQLPRQHPAVLEQQDALPFTNGAVPNEATSAPSPAAETTTDVERPRVRYSFLGLPPSQESESGAGPSKKCPSPVSDEEQNLLGQRSRTASSALLTPPQSAEPHANRVEIFAPTAGGGSGSRPEPATPTRHKGKERASAEWDRLMEAEEDLFAGTTLFRSGLESDALQRASRSPRLSLDSRSLSHTPTPGERITSNMIAIRDAIQTLTTYADNIDQLDAAKYVERLERQKNALTAREEAKRKRIAELSAERDELKEQLRQSEERCRAKDQIIASLEARY